ncbi:MAG: aminotransferase class V-fold PLP-dependent enzyme, partial [Candidatus Omnitrophica bacterium]|nr:aminotransferase class V-fold PLP-dependent enzyme [Candidatus Omnitrophota bacterium]
MTDNRPIYLDCQATTPVDPRVLEEMTPTFTEAFGNAASKHHRYGWEASKLVETARARIAGLIGCSSKEILFTSGATEANNLALRGVLAQGQPSGRTHLVVSAIEHPAVLDTAKMLARHGAELTVLSVDREGRIGPDALARALRSNTALVSIMLGNNETGVVQDLRALGAVCREAGV